MREDSKGYACMRDSGYTCATQPSLLTLHFLKKLLPVGSPAFPASGRDQPARTRPSQVFDDARRSPRRDVWARRSMPKQIRQIIFVRDLKSC
ncbi:hypothetical protein BC2230_20509 [Burkholderia cepacia]